MTKRTKTILGVVAVGGLLYYAFKKNWLKNPFSNFTGDDNFFDANGLTRRRASGVCTQGDNSPSCNQCGESCEGGICYVAVYDDRGNVTYSQRRCSGTRNTQIQQLT